MKNLILSVFALSCFTAIGAASLDQRADSILSTLTLNEKIGQMIQINCDDVTPQLLKMIERGEVGSILNASGIDNVNILQQAAMKSRAGIPLVFARDVIHGYHTIFPIPLGQAASFDPDIVETGARVAAAEATCDGIKWTFAPMLDLARDPRWGRIAESFGEDPHLASVMGSAMVKGFQGNNPADLNSMAACAKHFAGYGAAEGGRDYNSTNIPDRLLHNMYLPPFQAAVDSGALTVMTSFNANDGVPSTGNRHLLRDILRDEMGFEGMVVSDWNSVGEMITHGFAADGRHAAALAALAGLEMDMHSGLFREHLASLVEDGSVPVTYIDDAVRNILKLKLTLGLFENPYTTTSGSEDIFYSAQHLEAARNAAAKAAVLLKNQGEILPLSPSSRIAVIGPMADAHGDQMGTWVFDGEASHTVTPLDALKNYPENQGIRFEFDPILSLPTSRDTTAFHRLDKIMENADVAVVFLGEEARLSGEAHSLADINLIGAQSRLLKAVHRYGKPVVTVIMSGRPITLERDLPFTDALLFNFHPGTMGGPAIIDLLFGREIPSGKLPVTFPRSTGQIPLFYNHDNTGRPAPDGVVTLYNDNSDDMKQTSAGDVSTYLDQGKDPLFPFGYGLSYTTFEYSSPTLSASLISPGDSITISATVTNTGNRTATDVAQLYVRDCVGSIVRPVKELKKFRKVTLDPGQSAVVTFTLTTDDLAFHGLNGKRGCEPGRFLTAIGGDSSVKLSGEFYIR